MQGSGWLPGLTGIEVRFSQNVGGHRQEQRCSRSIMASTVLALPTGRRGQRRGPRVRSYVTAPTARSHDHPAAYIGKQLAPRRNTHPCSRFPSQKLWTRNLNKSLRFLPAASNALMAASKCGVSPPNCRVLLFFPLVPSNAFVWPDGVWHRQILPEWRYSHDLHAAPVFAGRDFFDYYHSFRNGCEKARSHEGYAARNRRSSHWNDPPP